MIISEKRLVRFLRNNPVFTTQQARLLHIRGNRAVICLDCYCFKCVNDCEKENSVLVPYCSEGCEKPVSRAKVKGCFKF